MCTPCVHHEEPMSLDVIPNPNSLSRLFPILLDPKSFQTALDSITWLPGHMPISYSFVHCRLIIIILIYVQLTLTLAKVCPHTRLITIPISDFFPSSEVATMQQTDGAAHKLKPRLFHKSTHLWVHSVDFHPSVNRIWHWVITSSSKLLCLIITKVSEHLQLPM